MPRHLSSSVIYWVLSVVLCGAPFSGIVLAASPLAGALISNPCDENYSILRDRDHRCETAVSKSAEPSPSHDARRETNVLNPDWLRAEMAAFSIIGVAQIRGGTGLLRDIWYAGAILVPPFMPSGADHRAGNNYLAIAPPFIALGIINDYLRRDGAEDPRVFLTNFVAFNLGLVWSHAILNEPGANLPVSSTRMSWQPGFDTNERLWSLTLNMDW